MKKNVLLMTILSLVCASAYSQGISFGIKAGVNVADVAVSSSGNVSSPDPLIGIHGGAYLTAMFTEHIGLQPEVLYSGEGYKSGSQKLHLNYITIPVLFRYSVNDLLSFHVGPQFGILASAKDQDSNDAKDLFKSSNLGVAIGGAIDLPMGLNFTLRYVAGLSNISNFDTAFTGSNPTIKTGNFQISVGYKLFGGK